ncbi:MAG: glycosyl transferase family 1, partial [Firmicutes bacterium HGW-Firmicutes-13]
VAIEAMATKTPVVVGDTGGFSEIVEHEKDGLKFTPGDTLGLARSVIRLFRDEKLAEKLCLNAWQKIISEYNWNTIAEQTRSVYKEILLENRRVTPLKA